MKLVFRQCGQSYIRHASDDCGCGRSSSSRGRRQAEAQANPAPIAYGIAGLIKPELEPPHLLTKTAADTALEVNLKAFLQAFAANDLNQDGLITSRFKSTTNSLFRNHIPVRQKLGQELVESIQKEV